MSLLTETLKDINYKKWGFRTGEDFEGTEWVQVVFAPYVMLGQRPDEQGLQYGRKWRISAHMTKSEIVQTCLKAVLAAEEHEAREFFLYKRESIFSPHYDVDALHALRSSARLDLRPEASA